MAAPRRFTWEYDDGRDRLLALYQKGKDKQWDAVTRVDWDLEVDPYDPLELPGRDHARLRLAPEDRRCRRQDPQAWCRRHAPAWQFRQFLHGEQGAMICAARIVESGTGPGREVLRGHPDHGRGPPRRDLRPLPPARRSAWPTRSTPTCRSLLDSHSARLRAGTCPTWACRCSSRAWRWPPRRHARHDHQARSPSRSSPTSCRTRPATSPSAGWRCATTTPA